MKRLSNYLTEALKPIELTEPQEILDWLNEDIKGEWRVLNKLTLNDIKVEKDGVSILDKHTISIKNIGYIPFKIKYVYDLRIIWGDKGYFDGTNLPDECSHLEFNGIRKMNWKNHTIKFHEVETNTCATRFECWDCTTIIRDARNITLDFSDTQTGSIYIKNVSPAIIKNMVKNYKIIDCKNLTAYKLKLDINDLKGLNGVDEIWDQSNGNWDYVYKNMDGKWVGNE